MSKRRYVADTSALISYYFQTFNVSSQISRQGGQAIRRALDNSYDTLLTVPSVVFVEIFDKWFTGTTQADEERRQRIRAEVIFPITQAPNIEIRELDKEIIQKFAYLKDLRVNLENRDRIVLATASVLNATLITSDTKIRNLVDNWKISLTVI